MLKKENRLTSNFEFNVSRKYGKPFRGYYFNGYAVKPTNYTGPAKIGIVVPNKLHKSAVKRNQIRRQYREIVYQNLFKMGENIWWVIYPKIASLGADHEKLSADFNQALQKVSVAR